MNSWSLVCKLFPASPLVPVTDGNGKRLRFDAEFEARVECTELNKRSSSAVAGGGPYYFVVQDS